jgi:hypothetical protein
VLYFNSQVTSLNYLIEFVFQKKYGYVKCKFYSGGDSNSSVGFGSGLANETAFQLILRKTRQLFTTNQRAGYAQGQAGFEETF